MSASVHKIDAAARSETLHGRAAELVARQRQLNDQLAAFFREVDEVRGLLREDGSLWEGPALDPPVEAAFHAFRDRGPKETRVELERVGEPPLMPLEPEPVLRPPEGYGW